MSSLRGVRIIHARWVLAGALWYIAMLVVPILLNLPQHPVGDVRTCGLGWMDHPAAEVRRACAP